MTVELLAAVRDELDRRDKLAGEATQGEWKLVGAIGRRAGEHPGTHVAMLGCIAEDFTIIVDGNEKRDVSADAAFIAAGSPASWLALSAALRTILEGAAGWLIEGHVTELTEVERQLRFEARRIVSTLAAGLGLSGDQAGLTGKETE